MIGWVWVRYHLVRGFKFSVVGAIGAIFSLSLQYALTEYLHVWYLESALIAIFLSFFSNYFLNYYWTFKKDLKGFP